LNAGVDSEECYFQLLSGTKTAMERGIGEIELLQEYIPEWLATPIALFTQLGDVWFLVLLLGVLYLSPTTNRDAIAAVSGVTLAGLAFMDSLKHIFALPRPDQPLLPTEELPVVLQPLYEATAFSAGYGFPSGHALMTTIVYLSLADVLSVSTRKRRYLTASFLIVTVSLSRIALGVHYLVDIVVGVGLGFGFLIATRTISTSVSDKGTAAFGLAVVLAGLNLLISPADTDALQLAGASLGAFTGWQLIGVTRGFLSERDQSKADRLLWGRVITATIAITLLVAALGFNPVTSPLAQSGILGLGVAVFVLIPMIRDVR
jgi:membrane-associated phospholipid phosphatase